MYVIYDVKDSDVCVGVYDTVKEIANLWGITPNHVSSIISKKKKFKCRYSIEVVKDEKQNN
jgi:hypothetical protein